MSRALQVANQLTAAAAEDHGYPLVWLHNIALVDVRRKFPDVARMRPRDLALVQYVSIHHDAVFYARDPLPGDDFAAEMERLSAVYAYHVGNGWGGIGYHTYGFPSGRLYLVGDYHTQRANVAKQNHVSIGHCVAGDFTERPPDLGSQLVAAMAAIAAWAALRRMVAVRSHRSVALPSDPTACPGATQDQWVPALPRAIAAIAKQRA